MKKWMLSIFSMVLSFLMIGGVYAEDLYYLPETGSNYFRSQHTYSFWYKNGEYHDEFAPTISDLRKNTLDEDLDYESFASKYRLPWTVSEQDYVIVLCADLDTSLVDKAAYRRVPIMESTYVADDAKENIIGILKNSYPYISADEMIANMVKAGTIVEKTVGGKKYYTAKENAKPTLSLTEDEIVTAVQMAIFNYTNPGQIKDLYFNTTELYYPTITTVQGIHEYVYDYGHYQEVSNNIKAVYNYLIAQKDEDAIFNIREVTATKKDKEYEFHVITNRKVNDKDELYISLTQGDAVVAKEKMNDLTLDNNGAYVFRVKNVDSLNEEDELAISGKEYAYEGVYVYEAVEGKDFSQTQIGVSTDYRSVETANMLGSLFNVSSVNAGNNSEMENPNTLDNGVYYMIALVLSLFTLGIAMYLRKKHVMEQ